MQVPALLKTRIFIGPIWHEKVNWVPVEPDVQCFLIDAYVYGFFYL